ncbi:MAG: Calx-beta domain-containing protein [Actinomycetota bacterium]
MKYRLGHLLAATGLAAASVSVAGPPAAASFHLTNVTEVFAGAADEASAQFVELQLRSGGNNFVQGLSVTVFNSSGTQVGSFTFASSPPNGASQSSILVATSAAETYFGVDADLVMTPVIPAGGGKACFENVDCVSWGNYTGNSTSPSPSGTPLNAPDGIPADAAMVRDISGGSNPNGLDGGDDTNDSAADFALGSPTPRNNAGQIGSPQGPRIQFNSATYDVGEDAGSISITVIRTGDASGSASVDYATEGGSATVAEDYQSASGTLTFADAETSQSFSLQVVDDESAEDNETVGLSLSNATGAGLGLSSATLTIDDDDGVDATPPLSEIDRPDHRGSYKANKLTRLRGTAADDDSDVARVEVALRRKLAGGGCKWLDRDSFVRRACGSELWNQAAGTSAWTYDLESRLAKSEGYTLFARSEDSAGNVESSFETGRNKARFEIK